MLKKLNKGKKFTCNFRTWLKALKVVLANNRYVDRFTDEAPMIKKAQTSMKIGNL